MEFDGFQWDAGNWPKCAKHGLTQSDIEAVFLGEPTVYPDVSHSEDEERFLAIGAICADRWGFVAFCIRRDDEAVLIRPISARPMREKEVSRYVEDVEKPAPSVQ